MYNHKDILTEHGASQDRFHQSNLFVKLYLGNNTTGFPRWIPQIRPFFYKIIKVLVQGAFFNIIKTSWQYLQGASQDGSIRQSQLTSPQ